MYGGQISRGPVHDPSYIVAYGSGVSNGSCGSNSSTNRKKRSCCPAFSSIQRAVAAIVFGPGKSVSSRKYERDRAYTSRPANSISGAPVALGSGRVRHGSDSCPRS